MGLRPLFAAIVGSNPAVGMDVCLFLSVVCCQVEVSALGRSLVQRSPTECGVCIEYDREVSYVEAMTQNRVEAPRWGGNSRICLNVSANLTYKTVLFIGYLTLRRLMSYIYMKHPFLMFLDHTQRRSTVGRTPLDE